jgi:hypothetical protein
MEPVDDGVEEIAMQTVALGSNPILQDVATAHQSLLAVRHGVAQAVAQVNNKPAPVVAISIVSAGSDINDQLVVFSPGGEGARNAHTVHHRLLAAAHQIEMLIKQNKFGG